MRLHHYHPETGVYLGASDAHVDPEELAIRQRAHFAERSAAAKGRYMVALEQIGAPGGELVKPQGGVPYRRRTEAQERAVSAAWEAYQAEIAVAREEAAALEPAHWLIPAHATTEAPPEPPKGKTAAFRDGRWTHVRASEA